jgi:glycerol-1-phosphate dehydrogenase [NAD(P)+]
MDPKYMQLPRAVIVGKGVYREINTVCTDLGLGGSALVVTDSTTISILGERVIDRLSSDFDVENHIISDATEDEIARTREVLSSVDARFLVGIGGGKVIDVAKLSSRESGIEFISMPTAASHDGMASSRASIKKDGGSVSIQAHSPLGVVADTGVIGKSPYRLYAAGCGDIISKYTATMDWELAHRIKGEEISEYAIALSRMTSEIIMNSRDTIAQRDDKSVRRVVKALISSGVAMSIAGSSRPGSGSEHKFSHALDMIVPQPALHGEQCGVGTIMMMYLHGGDWEGIRDALQKIGAPVDAEGLGIEDRYIVDALQKAGTIRPQRYTILEHNPLSRREAERLARETGVIG